MMNTSPDVLRQKKIWRKWRQEFGEKTKDERKLIEIILLLLKCSRTEIIILVCADLVFKIPKTI